MRSNSVKSFLIWTSGSAGDVFKRYFFSGALVALFAQQTVTICAISEGGFKRNNSVKLF